ncbi:MAG: glycosyltransferase family 61 protein [Bacteroidota bacterium]
MFIYKKESIFSPLEVNNALPANITDADLYLFKDDVVKSFPEVSLNFVKNISVTPHGILFNKFKILDQFLIWQEHKNEFNFFYLLRNYFNRKKLETKSTDKFLICFDYWSLGYFHWMCDFLPRLIAAEKYLNDYTLVLPNNHAHSFVEDSLKVFGVKNVLRFSDKEYVTCSDALIPDYVSNSGDNNPFVMTKLRQKFIDFYTPRVDHINYAKHIYVSRARAKGRYIENETEVIKMLESLGYKTIYFEEYSLKEQISIAFNCKNLIGLHGANLTNLIFMNPNANILELRKENDRRNNYYFSLASSFHLNYFYLQCRATETSNSQTFNLNVDITSLKKIAERMLND